MRKIVDPVPVQGSRDGHVSREIAEIAWRAYERRWPSAAARQPLEKIIERGGFSWAELVVLLFDDRDRRRRPRPRPFDELAGHR